MTIQKTRTINSRGTAGTAEIQLVRCDGTSDALSHKWQEAHAEYLDMCEIGQVLPGTVIVSESAGDYLYLVAAYETEEDHSPDFDKLMRGLDDALADITFLGLRTPFTVHLTGVPHYQAVRSNVVQAASRRGFTEDDLCVITPDVEDDTPWDPIPRRCLTGAYSADQDFSIKTLLSERAGVEHLEPYTRDIGCYHPSTLSTTSCTRQLAYERLGVQPCVVPTFAGTQAIFDLGHAAHAALQGRLSKLRGPRGERFVPEVPVVYEPLHIRGSADGVFGNWVLEIKTIGSSGFGSLTKPKSEHVSQVHLYMFGLDIPQALILYINRDNGELREFRVLYEERVMLPMLSKIDIVESHLRAGKLPDRHVTAGCSNCKFAHACLPTLKKT